MLTIAEWSCGYVRVLFAAKGGKDMEAVGLGQSSGTAKLISRFKIFQNSSNRQLSIALMFRGGKTHVNTLVGPKKSVPTLQFRLVSHPLSKKYVNSYGDIW